MFVDKYAPMYFSICSIKHRLHNKCHILKYIKHISKNKNIYLKNMKKNSDNVRDISKRMLSNPNDETLAWNGLSLENNHAKQVKRSPTCHSLHNYFI